MRRCLAAVVATFLAVGCGGGDNPVVDDTGPGPTSTSTPHHGG